VKYELITSMYVFLPIIMFCKPPYAFLHFDDRFYQNNSIVPFNFFVIGSSRNTDFEIGELKPGFGRLCGVRFEDGTVFHRLKR
jgi:hypothetical protein